MPRKTKDSENKDVELKENNNKKVAKSTTKKVTARKTTTKKASEEKDSKAETKTKTTKVTKATATKAKVATKKSTSSTKKAETVKETANKKAANKKNTTKKVSEEKNSKVEAKTKTAKTAKAKSTTKKVSVRKPESVEYYDLPYRYNQTVVKILAQTPTNLFIYWDISDEDRQNYKKQYGENFFETTKPILKIYNDTLHYDFEIEINDFANSWYLHINDSKCDYRAELGRRPISNENNIKENYIYIYKILFNTLDKMVYFKNTKTNAMSEKSFANLSFMKNMGKIYNIYDFYRELYKDEDIESFSNPSSGIF